MTPDIETGISQISDRLSAVQMMMMTVAGKRLAELYGKKELSAYLYSEEYLNDTGKDLRQINKALNTAHKMNIKDMNSLFKGVTAEVYSAGKEMAEHKDTRLSPLSSYRQEASPLLRQVMSTYETMAKSSTVNNDYKKTIRQYVNRLTMGGEDNAPTAMRRAIRELTEQGITTIDYKSGRHVRMDTAVRRDLMAEYTNIVQQVQNKVGEEIGADAFEISAHQHSAEDHEPIQGRIFTIEEFEKLQNGEEARDVDIEKYEAGEADYLGEVFQTDRPIGLWNCRHLYFSFILGVSIPSATREELEAIQERNEDGIEFHGEHYTLYEAEQEQRRLETAMRHERENLNLLKEVRETSSQAEHDYQKSKARLAELRSEYHALGDKLKPLAIREKMERSYVPKIIKTEVRSPPSLIESGKTTSNIITIRDNEPAIKTIKALENNIRNDKYETGIIVNTKTGEFIETFTDNKVDRVKIPHPEFLLDNTFSHNHSSGRIFSVRDLEEYLKNNAYEFRVPTSNETFSIRRDYTRSITRSIANAFKKYLISENKPGGELYKFWLENKKLPDYNKLLLLRYNEIASEWLANNAEKYGHIFSVEK